MTKRSSGRQTRHDDSVRRRAIGLKTNDWKVKADVPKFPKPPIINGSRPDIYATKGNHKKIIEVETRDSVRKDKQQHKNLRRYARSKKNTEFVVRTVD